MIVTPDAYLAALRYEGLRVDTSGFWAATPNPERWRDTRAPGEWEPVGILTHHTGPWRTLPSILALLEHGHSTLTGPLCHVATAPDGTIYPLAWGAANHAGRGDAAVLSAIQRDLIAPSPSDTEATRISGTRWFFGNEIIHSGDPNQPMPDAQRVAAEGYAAAVCRLMAWSPRRALFHRSWTVRKTDPATLDLTAFQAAVAKRLAPPPPIFVPGRTDDMPVMVRDILGHAVLTDLATFHQPLLEPTRVLLATDGGVETRPRSDALYAYATGLPKRST